MLHSIIKSLTDKDLSNGFTFDRSFQIELEYPYYCIFSIIKLFTNVKKTYCYFEQPTCLDK